MIAKKYNKELADKLKWHNDTLIDMVDFIYEFAQEHGLLSDLETHCDNCAEYAGYPMWKDGIYQSEKKICGNED